MTPDHHSKLKLDKTRGPFMVIKGISDNTTQNLNDIYSKSQRVSPSQSSSNIHQNHKMSSYIDQCNKKSCLKVDKLH